MLEPSAGTGLLAILAELAGASIILNEFADSRAGVLTQLFPAISTTQFDAAHINDHLDARVVPSVVLMNPPFSVAVHVDRQMADAALRHIGSALARLSEGGRLVTITGANVAPENPAWTDSFKRLQEQGRVVFSAAIDGAVYAKHGTSIDTRLTVIDRAAGCRSARASLPHPALRLTCRLCSPGSCNTCRHVGQLLALRLRWCRRMPALPRLEPSAPTSAGVNQRWRQQLTS